MTLFPERVEQAITPRTSAILGVHLFGNPCADSELETLKKQYGLKLIYDAAHAFGTRIENTGIGCYGDATMFSLHATKLFHTAEGGALAVGDADLKLKIDNLRNFGIRDEFNVIAPGINGKMNELQAALGLEVLPLFAEETLLRSRVRGMYRARLSKIPGVSLVDVAPGVFNNQQFLALRIREDSPIGTADQVYTRLRKHQIYARRYFCPLVSEYPHYRGLASAHPSNLPVAQRVSREVLCLPIFGSLTELQLDRICDLVSNSTTINTVSVTIS